MPILTALVSMTSTGHELSSTAVSIQSIEEGRAGTARVTAEANRTLDPILAGDNAAELLREQILHMDGDRAGRIAILSFRALQLHRIAQLEAALITHQNHTMNPEAPQESTPSEAGSETQKNDPSQQVDALIQKYADAVRNYETLCHAVPFDKNSKYEFLGANQEFKIIKREGKLASDWDASWWTKARHGFTVVPYQSGPLGFRELDRRRQSERDILSNLKSRFHMALFGGLALITPMLIMANKQGLVSTLVTASVATVIFAAAIVVIGDDLSGKDVLASTAAYTAVLVVFVGTSLGPECTCTVG